jgi:hypothetical protein
MTNDPEVGKLEAYHRHQQAGQYATATITGTIFLPGGGSRKKEPRMNSKISRRRHAPRLATFLLVLAAAILAWPGGSPALAAFSNGKVAAPVEAIQAAPPLMPRVNVAIQVGHWKESELPDALARLRGSTGTSGGGRTEVSLNLDIAQRVAAQLRAAGRTVEILPATVPTGYEADLFVALHADGNSSGAARGYKVSTR